MDLLQAFQSDNIVPTKNDVIAAVEDNLVLVGAAKATEEPKMTLSVTLL